MKPHLVYKSPVTLVVTFTRSDAGEIQRWLCGREEGVTRGYLRKTLKIREDSGWEVRKRHQFGICRSRVMFQVLLKILNCFFAYGNYPHFTQEIWILPAFHPGNKQLLPLWTLNQLILQLYPIYKPEKPLPSMSSSSVIKPSLSAVVLG